MNKTVRDRADHGRIIHVLLNRARVLGLIGRNQKALKDLERGLALACRTGNEHSQAECLLQFSETYSYTGEYEGMHRTAEQSLAASPMPVSAFVRPGPLCTRMTPGRWTARK